MTPPAPHRISVVVQGPIVGKPGDAPEARLSLRCLQSIREHLPGAEIVLSTWKGSDLRELDFDVLVESDDPGAVSYTEGSHSTNNVNRQILSTRSGIAKATRPYLLKLRTDMTLRGRGFLSYFDAFPVRSEWSFLRSKVIVSTVFSRLPLFARNWVRSPEDILKSRRQRGYQLNYGWPYHPSDWYHFGLREDVEAIWDIPLAQEPDLTHWFRSRPRPRNDLGPASFNRFAPEQYIWLSCLRKFRPVEFDHKWDVTESTVADTERTFASNLIMISSVQSQIAFTKYRLPKLVTGRFRSLYDGAASCYSHGLWKEAYERICRKRTMSAASAHRVRLLAVAVAYRIFSLEMALRMKVARARGRI